jgi:hypothetical protein
LNENDRLNLQAGKKPLDPKSEEANAEKELEEFDFVALQGLAHNGRLGEQMVGLVTAVEVQVEALCCRCKLL